MLALFASVRYCGGTTSPATLPVLDCAFAAALRSGTLKISTTAGTLPPRRSSMAIAAVHETSLSRLHSLAPFDPSPTTCDNSSHVRLPFSRGLSRGPTSIIGSIGVRRRASTRDIRGREADGDRPLAGGGAGHAPVRGRRVGAGIRRLVRLEYLQIIVSETGLGKL